MGDSGTNSVKLHFEVRYRGKSLDHEIPASIKIIKINNNKKRQRRNVIR
jgi:murein DD-endopeptidase MepM/ murein hydrolase activator NlpD